MYGPNLERRISDKILYEVDSCDNYLTERYNHIVKTLKACLTKERVADAVNFVDIKLTNYTNRKLISSRLSSARSGYVKQTQLILEHWQCNAY
jgi:hypothetical protein